MSAFEFSGHPLRAAAPSSLSSNCLQSPLAARWVVDRDAARVPDARHHIRQLAETIRYGLGEDVELLASELLGNAVLHGQGPTIRIAVIRTMDALRVEVHDNGETEPDVTHEPDLLAERGRGLLIIQALATRWGLDHHGQDGTTAWFQVDIRPLSSDTAEGPNEVAVS